MQVYNQPFDCHFNVKGHFVLLELPEARNWTDYSVEVRVYSNHRQFGILFRYLDKLNHYRYVADTAGNRCQAFTKMSGGVGKRLSDSCLACFYPMCA